MASLFASLPLFQVCRANKSISPIKVFALRWRDKDRCSDHRRHRRPSGPNKKTIRQRTFIFVFAPVNDALQVICWSVFQRASRRMSCRENLTDIDRPPDSARATWQLSRRKKDELAIALIWKWRRTLTEWVGSCFNECAAFVIGF